MALGRLRTWQLSMLEGPHFLQGWEAMLLPQCRRKALLCLLQALAAKETRGCCGRVCSEPTKPRCMAVFPVGMTCPAFLPATALAGGVWKPPKQLVFLQPGPPLSGLGFLKPCVSDTVSINQGGRHQEYRLCRNLQSKP